MKYKMDYKLNPKNHKKQGICYIVGAGECYGLDFIPGDKDLVIAADGGYWHLQQAGIRTDLLIGDFDSLMECLDGMDNEMPDQLEQIRLPVEKDDTDTLAAVKEGEKRGYITFYLYGGTGGRFDHTLANLQLLAYLSMQGKQGFMVDRECVMTAITNGQIQFDASRTGRISVFSYTDQSIGVSERGLRYTLEDATLTSQFPIGVSNEFMGVESEISVQRGTLLLVYAREHEKE